MDRPDLQLPAPLLHPRAWPKAGLVSIAQIAMGGPIEKLWHEIAKSGTLTLSVPSNFWTEAVANEPSLSVITDSRLALLTCSIDIVSRQDLQPAEKLAWNLRLGERVRYQTDESLRMPTLFEWSAEIFPKAVKDAGELNWRRLLQTYETEIGEGGFISMDRLRYLSGFLRDKDLRVCELAGWDWARAQALFSPQDDSEGTGNAVIVNPSLQIEKDRAVWRMGEDLNESKIGWQEGAVFDELRESPKMARTSLLLELSQKKFPFKASDDFNRVIESMLNSRMLLSRPV